MPSVRLVQFMLFFDKVIHRLTPMLPTAKRAADDAWQQGNRVRTALVAVASALTQLDDAVDGMYVDAPIEMSADMMDVLRAQAAVLPARLDALCPPTVLPALPADCWGVVMEFALERRSMATFGAGGAVNEATEWLPYGHNVPPVRIRRLRLVSRTWCRLASALVRAIVIEPTNQAHAHYIPAPAVTFPNVRYVDVRVPKLDYSPYIGLFVDALEQNAQRLHGCPPPPNYSRICVRRIDSNHAIPRRVVGKNDTIFWHVTNNTTLAVALTKADVVFLSYNFKSEGTRPIFATPFPLRARIIVISSNVDGFLPILLTASDERARKNVCIYTGTVWLAKIIWEWCAPLNIRQFPPVTATTTANLPVDETINNFITDCFLMFR